MMRNGKTLALALSALALGNGVQALTSDSPGGPYHGIVERNIFDIHAAAPPPPPDPNASLPPPPNIRLQGITDILGRKQVLFKVQLPAKPPNPAKEESFILTIGERQGEIEVLEINPKAGTVKMKNYGVVTNLSLELNSDKLVSVAPPMAAPAPPPNVPQMTAPGTIAPPPTLPGLPGKFPRTLRLPGANNTQASPSQPGGANYGSYGGGGGGTGFGSASANPNVPHDQSVPQPYMSPEARALIIEAQRLKYQNEGNSMSTIMPPTAATPRGNDGETPPATQLP